MRVIKGIEDLKVDDKVVIRDDLEVGLYYNEWCFALEMEEGGLLGSTAKVLGVHCDEYVMIENTWGLTEPMIDWDATRKVNGAQPERGLRISTNPVDDACDCSFAIEYDAELVGGKVRVPCKFTGEQFPKYGKEGDSALDLFALSYREISDGELQPTQDFTDDGYVLLPHERILVPTGLKLSLPDDIDCTIRPRSGLTLKYGIVVQIGTIDNNYTGDVGMIVLNTSNYPYTIRKGDRLGQLRFSKPILVELVEDELKETNRGETGFGQSGR